MSEKYQEFLLEVGTEEIPAWMIPSALDDLKRNLEKAFAELRLRTKAPLETYATPRRLVAHCSALMVRQLTFEEMVEGPPKRIAFDASGNPTTAAIKFAEKMGTLPQKLKTVVTPKGEYLAFHKVSKGKPTLEVLKEAIPAAVMAIPFPKTMHWEGRTGPHFIRPIRNLLVLYGGKGVPCSIGSVASGKFTFGHRRLGKPRLAVKNYAEYREALRTNGVLLDPEERRARILTGAEELLRPEKTRLKLNEDLLNTLVYITEYPTPLLGSFDDAYLALAEEVLITVMRGHQKYLAVEQANGKMAPRFIAVMETDGDHTGVIRHGHERVLRARFKDAQFFWETDGKRTLEQRLELLRTVTFQSKLGSYYEKAQRMADLTNRLMSLLRASEPSKQVEWHDTIQAARLAKCDLTTDLVKEFTELQGVIGGLYAKRENLSSDIAEAIYDHYKPQSMEDTLPRSLAGDIVSIADRVDTLVGCFGVGLAPSGSKDPFGLRRAAQGVIRIVAEKNLPFFLDALVASGCETYAALQAQDQVSTWDQQRAQKELLPFFEDRLRYYLREVRGFAYDEVNAVLEARGSQSKGKTYHVADILKRLEAVAKIRPTENFEPLAAQFKRIKNILEQARQAHGFQAVRPQEHMFRDEAERKLFERSRAVSQQIYDGYESELKAIASLRPDVDLFFDKILVMAPEPELRNNRLSLLSFLLDDLSTIADFSEIVPREAADHVSASPAH